MTAASDPSPAGDAPESVHEDRLWIDDGWTARVIKNEDDDGWAVAMLRRGEPEPALVGPWTMGRDKKNPKPLDSAAFHTLVKTANEVIRRHEQQTAARLHKREQVDTAEGRVTVKLDIVPDDDQPYAELSAANALGEELARVRVAPNFRLGTQSAADWIASGYERPGRAD